MPGIIHRRWRKSIEIVHSVVVISKIIPSLLKDATKIPETVLDQDTEFETLDNAKDFIREEFGCDVEVIKAEDSKEAKAKISSPGKPSILVN